jgi:arsenate reductase
VGIDLTSGRATTLVLAVRDNAKESWPVFFGKATRLHHSFNDPAAVEGSEEKRLEEFRRVRDELRAYLRSIGIAPT